MKFINLSDVHLAASLDFESSYSDIIRKVKWESFENILKNNMDVDFALISGDLFERDFFMSKDYEKLFKLIKDFGKNTYYVTGNHDYIDLKNEFFFENKPSNLYIFDKKRMNFFEHKNTRIYGISYEDRIFSKRFNYGLSLNKDYFNIAILHGEISSTKSNYLSLDLSRLKEIGFNYVGLGHIHKRENFGNEIYYVGSIEPQSFKDGGIYGYIYYNGERVNYIDNKNLSFKTINLDLDDFSDFDQVITYLGGEISGSYKFLRLNINNYDKFKVSEKKLYQYLDLTYLKISKEKSSTYYYNLSKNFPNTLLDDFYQKVSKLNMDDPINQKCLEIGMDAILRSKNV